MKSKTHIYAVATGTGCCIPSVVVKNDHFVNYPFMNEDGTRIETPGEEIVEKFQQITDIRERRYAEPGQTTSDMAVIAARQALEAANFDPERLDYIIMAHNLGDIHEGSNYPDILPTLASRIKQKLGIKNHKTVCYDITFGCPGWIQAAIQANYYIKSGDAKAVLVVGGDTLSRSVDIHDRDTMIFADGAGAAIFEARESDEPVGMLKHVTRTDALEQLDMLAMGASNNPEDKNPCSYLKMKGRLVYNYALSNVPLLAKECLDINGLHLHDVKKVLIHQANAKMDEAILKRLFKLYGEKDMDMNVMPMTIDTLGNSSVATVPTLFDLIVRGKIDGHSLQSGDYVMMTSVGAGMNINAFMYKMP
ncbi:3-oxoacyl-[acyl-carrier-protein] synthase-3 [Breznakibacter xylanolyticus]|uniref:3-oxoacyl-[acyl-carrier-protein] synthase-3 n=1 Tax=Breznakibacter xylanolyticus TaxID=990 RepID=A0A2W7NGN6_9BACT|nr:ketoacyl-ACP synthase III [Breznakibacter xylanolyticus]MBN2742881.1 ketoacyl-ACP synthase III [Marinilabiliaceae bacterium]PZX19398.1 3-oxoacyl-[acyl-carrier-protein] synthase-3 [Breznakibacter xylanolyticus]